MRNEPKQRGSALMMVVGLLTMIGMLGATFLIITRLDARQSMIIESKSQATPLGAGVVARAGDILVEYLKIGSDGPHSTVQAGRNGWLDMLFYPDDDLCEHLATDEGAAPHKSDILGTSTTLVDCDYDGTDDAYLVASGVVNSKGEEYYVALKLVDLGGKLCVNVTGSNADADLTTPWSPAKVTTVRFVTGGRTEPVMPARSTARSIRRPRAQWGMVSCSSRFRACAAAPTSYGGIAASVVSRSPIVTPPSA